MRVQLGSVPDLGAKHLITMAKKKPVDSPHITMSCWVNRVCR